jgi:hypothetical protein
MAQDEFGPGLPYAQGANLLTCRVLTEPTLQVLDAVGIETSVFSVSCSPSAQGGHRISCRRSVQNRQTPAAALVHCGTCYYGQR